MSAALEPLQQSEYYALQRCFLRPAMPRLQEALFSILSYRPKEPTLELSHLEGNEEGRATWERLAARGIIPMTWIDARERWFRWSQPHFDPKDAAQAVLLGSCIEQVAAAEALAHEAAARLRLFGVPMPRRVYWKLSRGNKWDDEGVSAHQPWMGFYQLLFESRLQAGRDSQQDTLISSHVNDYMDALRLYGGHHILLRDVFFLNLLEKFWGVAAASGWLVTNSATIFVDETRFLPDPLVGLSFSQLPNPFSPLVDIWRMGFGCIGFAKGCIVLLCP